MRQRHRLAREASGQERSSVEAAVALDVPRDEDPRKRFVGRQLQVRIILVVAQQDVVFRRPLLDQIVFERQRLDHRIGDDDLEPGDFVEQGIGFRVGSMSAEVIAHPIPQRARLPDVNRVAIRVEVQVDPWLLGQPADLFLQFVNGQNRYTMSRFLRS